jgi:2-dehydro-3-deoxyphosphogluconate aldolase / (4S)-4-hydroxy-2-oxoglutarate aldolase
MKVEDIMKISPLVPVIALDDVQDALPLAEALLEGGIGIMEITLRTKAGLESIQKIAKEMPEMAVGAGTIINALGFAQAKEYGAQFVFSPGISKELLEASHTYKLPFIPGVATASDVMMALNAGFEYCKLFPATAVGGVETLKAFSGPFASMKFCPTGGINLQNINDFLSLSNVVCAGGSWIVPKASINTGDFAQITKLCKEAIQQIKI